MYRIYSDDHHPLINASPTSYGSEINATHNHIHAQLLNAHVQTLEHKHMVLELALMDLRITKSDAFRLMEWLLRRSLRSRRRPLSSLCL